jgi:peroxiredoxin Q/BCP
MRNVLIFGVMSLGLLACGKEAVPAGPATTNAGAPVPASQPATPTASPPPAAAIAAPSTPTAIPTELKVLSQVPDLAAGKAAPDFTATAHDGTAIHLADLKGKPIVLYFYPKDETPGCTKEACAFRDGFDALKKKGVVLIGVSGDTDASHKAFAEHHKLPFLLVSDPKGELATAYGVPFKDGYAGRHSFVVGADGKLKKVYRKVDVSVHAQEIATDVM